MPQTTHPKNNRGMRTLPQKVPANRKPLFQNRRPNHLNVARSMKNNYVYDDNNKTELQDNEICDNDNYSEINDNGISDNCNGYDKELIDNYESDEEQTASRWTNFANSQSSEDTDYLNQPFPDKLESRSKSRHNVQESEGETQPRNGPQFNKNKGILKQPLPSMNAPNSINGQSCRNTLNSVTERISMKPSFLNNRNGNKTMKRNNFPDNFRGLGMLQSKRANTENVNCGYSKGGARRAIESMKQSQWKNVKNGQLAGLNVAGKDEGIGNNQQQSRKFGQVKLRSDLTTHRHLNFRAITINLIMENTCMSHQRQKKTSFQISSHVRLKPAQAS